MEDQCEKMKIKFEKMMGSVEIREAGMRQLDDGWWVFQYRIIERDGEGNIVDSRLEDGDARIRMPPPPEPLTFLQRIKQFFNGEVL